ncbi:TonB-dependent receptor plug domain-containing protein [Brevundimonas viscosa]|uniref:Iron complex outermembrane recepter protein n=1 Tax=Brevundimonas viscosa TaxID=871741 RepID=A0A1I6NSJ6_9CAUL|nr:TonB-dependent receptor [Brevundimonas viscosa]SFS30829.1 iron complex outermembrane recepter protein [Brevundimonas viscosa]
MSIVAGLAAVSVLGAGGEAAADAQGPQPQDLSGLTLEQLADIQVTSVSRRPEQLSGAAASVYVITRDDIRRSGAASLPEVLRLAPNLQVQRVGSVDYAITARGFNSFETANKLLVLIDGRSIYTTLFSGVLWDAQGLVLEDIERIEVISGPGGALYGANAVNGVINITTRSARDTQGPAISAGVGTDDRTLSLRHGGALGEAGAWRLFLTGFDRSDTEMVGGGSGLDAAAGIRAGGRVDWSNGHGDWMLQGDVYDHESPGDVALRGGFALGRWGRQLGDYGRIDVQAYYDRADRVNGPVEEEVRTWDVSLQQAIDLGRHAIVWGGGHRWVENTLTSPPGAATLVPASRDITLGNLFVQDQISLRDDLVLTLGVKVEDSSFTGVEVLPNARLAWSLDNGSLLWGAVSRAARTASRIDRDLTLPGFLVGGSFQSEILTAYELGYRARPARNLNLSVSAFYHDYTDLRTVAPDPATILPLRFANGGEGHTSGIEAWGSYEVSPRWRLDLGVVTLDKEFRLKPGETDISSLASVGDDPSWQVLLNSRAQLTDRLELDVHLRAVDELAASGVDGYVEADLRLGWRFDNGVELALTGSNLINDTRLETGDPGRQRVLGRSAYLTLRAGF